MKYLAVCTSGKWQMPILIEAHSHNILTIAIDSNPMSQGFQVADHRIISNLENLDFIFKEIRKITDSLIGAISYCSEAGISLAQSIMIEFGCPKTNLFNPLIATNKSIQRKIWRDSGIIQPYFEVYDSKCTALSVASNKKTPFVIKPADSSGSRGVSIINEAKDLSLHIEKAFICSNSNSIIIEDFMSGTEYTVEVFAYEGVIKPVLVTKKDKVGKDVLTVSKALWSVNPNNFLYSSITSEAVSAFRSLGLKNGPGHLEMIVDEMNGPIGIVEAAFRGGGFNLSSKLINTATGFDFTKACLSMFDKSLPEFKVQFYKPSVLFFYPTQKGRLKSIEGLNEVKQIEGVEIDVLAQIGEVYEEPNSDRDRLCSIIISAETENLLIDRKKYIESILFFHFED